MSQINKNSPYDAAIADLEVRISSLQATLDTLKKLRGQATGVPLTATQNMPRNGSESEIPHDAFFQMTIVDAAEKYLRLVKKTRPNAAVAQALLNGGMKSASKRFSEIVRVTLFRDSRFVQVNSEWGLAEWYPGMGRGPRSNDRAATPKKNGSSMKERTLKLLNSKPSEVFTAVEVAEQLREARPSVTTVLCDLAADGQIARPEKGKYQSKQAA